MGKPTTLQLTELVSEVGQLYNGLHEALYVLILTLVKPVVLMKSPDKYICHVSPLSTENSEISEQASPPEPGFTNAETAAP